MRLGGGLLVVLAVGAAGAGYWVLAGVVLAAIVAAVTARLPALGGTPVERYFGGIARLALVVVQAIVFGAYVVPAQPVYAAGALVVVVAVADFAGLKLPAVVTRWVTVVLIAAAVVLIVLCAAIAPVVTVAPIGAPSVLGIFLAAVTTLPFLVPVATDRVTVRALTLGGLAVLVALVALVQLGPVRLGLSATSIRDLLYAADAGQLQPLLTVVAVLATVPAALTTFTEVRERSAPDKGWRAAALAGVTLAAALFARVDVVLAVAGAATVLELGLRARRYREARARE
ncbi:sulfatase [Amycolatopsis sp. NPDC004368]